MLVIIHNQQHVLQCGSHEHETIKGPKRPTQPISAISNTRVKSMNKKTSEIDSNIDNNKINQPITSDDHIIDTYVNKVNSNNINRQ